MYIYIYIILFGRGTSSEQAPDWGDKLHVTRVAAAEWQHPWPAQRSTGGTRYHFLSLKTWKYMGLSENRVYSQ